MKNLVRIIFAIALISIPAVSQAQKGKKLKLESKSDTASYMLGVTIGSNIAEMPSKNEIDIDLLKRGIEDIMKSDTVFDMMQIQAFLSVYMQKQKDIANQELSKEQVKFLEENKTKEGVKVTESGLQYEVIKEGEGPKPLDTDKVKVHYKGSLIDGTVFDSSYDRETPTEFGLGQVIPGWTEGLQLMTPGSVYKLYIPHELGYGSRGAGGVIPPYATLIFEIELLEILPAE
ncbi:MAG TPA: peptidylprolyl isomerase [Bacteroidales bacterium]|jgi:FKBP-type peptidyl-prolyl cis-trans isomerase|nr:peptidylprolyl isomerase [Bacteroidales bacterium]